jgi:hypothetical protein
MRKNPFILGESGPLDETLERYGVPETLHFGLIHYIAKGLVPGHFLQAVLKNDLKEVIARGDDECLAALPAIVRWLYNEAPAPCWGSPEKVASWVFPQNSARNAELREHDAHLGATES